MVIKVPIYVEIEKADPQTLTYVVNDLGLAFTSILRKEDFANSRSLHLNTKVVKELGGFKIVPRDKALEYLRTKK
jgi:hypothetical protein